MSPAGEGKRGWKNYFKEIPQPTFSKERKNVPRWRGKKGVEKLLQRNPPTQFFKGGVRVAASF